MIGLNYLGRMGQLGNQMFQYAAIRGIAAKRGYGYTIPDHSEKIKDSLGNILRIELFDVFDIQPQQTGYLLVPMAPGQKCTFILMKIFLIIVQTM